MRLHSSSSFAGFKLCFRRVATGVASIRQDAFTYRRGSFTVEKGTYQIPIVFLNTVRNIRWPWACLSDQAYQVCHRAQERYTYAMGSPIGLTPLRLRSQCGDKTLGIVVIFMSR